MTLVVWLVKRENLGTLCDAWCCCVQRSVKCGTWPPTSHVTSPSAGWLTVSKTWRTWSSSTPTSPKTTPLPSTTQVPQVGLHSPNWWRWWCESQLVVGSPCWWCVPGGGDVSFSWWWCEYQVVVWVLDGGGVSPKWWCESQLVVWVPAGGGVSPSWWWCESQVVVV